jgi:hypothetical protein
MEDVEKLVKTTVGEVERFCVTNVLNKYTRLI